MTTRWLRRGTGPTLLCLPYSGGASYSFASLARHLPTWSDVASIDPPGHGTNRQPLLREFEELVDFYEQAAAPLLGRPLVLFGHSLGGLAVFRLAQRLERAGRGPSAVVISGAAPPDDARLAPEAWVDMTDDELLADLARLGATEHSLLANTDFRNHVFPTLRADAEVTVSFRDIDPAPLEGPAHLFAGRDDEDAPVVSMTGWGRRLSRYRLHVFDGPHMFLVTEAPAVATRLEAILLAVWRGSSEVSTAL